jgi:predicted Co/Zn/Cd cation transporter (cation efflux family)
MAGDSALNTTHRDLPGGEERLIMVRRGRALQYLTIAWNSGECVVALAAGFLAGSIALVGFGLDSAIEVTSSLAALWRLRRDLDETRREAAERRALQIIGICFLLLAAYVLYEAITTLVVRKTPEHSTVGIVLAALSLIVMPLLVYYKRRVASQLGSGALEAEARKDAGLRLPVGDPSRRPGSECLARLLMGRSGGWRRDGAAHRLGGS